MSRAYRISRDAKTDLLQIWNHLAETASFAVADKVINNLYVGMDKVAKRPGFGHRRTDLTELPVKFYLVSPYLVVFADEEKPIGIVRVLHSARDIPSILGKE